MCTGATPLCRVNRTDAAQKGSNLKNKFGPIYFLIFLKKGKKNQSLTASMTEVSKYKQAITFF
jgi:hypothetical protein